MPNEPVRSLLLIDADAAERRRISAIASRSGWTVVGADGLDTAVAILGGPYGPEVKVAIVGNWDKDSASGIIDSLREAHAGLPVLLLTEPDALPVEIGRAHV